jgi:hypothetical protein
METQIYFTRPKYNLKKILKKETNFFQDIIISLQLISSFNTSQNIMFQKSSYKNRPIIYYYYLGAYKNPLSYYYTL